MTKTSQSEPSKPKTAKPFPPTTNKSATPQSKAATPRKSFRGQPASPTQTPSRTASSESVTAKQPHPKGTSKQSQLIALLSRKTGCSLSEMMATTGWQAHSVRGVLSGTLRKRLGLNINRSVDVNGTSIYRIAS